MGGVTFLLSARGFGRGSTVRVPRDGRLGVREGGGIRRGEDPGHTDQGLLLGGMLSLTQRSGSGEMSRQGRNPCSGELSGCDRLCGGTPGRALWTRWGSGGGTRNWGLFLLSLIARSGPSEGLRGGGERKDTRDADQLLNSGADTEEEVGIRRGTSSGRREESVVDGVGRESQYMRCQSIRIDVWNRTPLGHRPCKPGVDVFEGSDSSAQVIPEAFFSRLKTNGPRRLVSDPRREVHCHTLTAHRGSRRRGGLRRSLARGPSLRVRGPKEVPRSGASPDPIRWATVSSSTLRFGEASKPGQWSNTVIPPFIRSVVVIYRDRQRSDELTKLGLTVSSKSLRVSF